MLFGIKFKEPDKKRPVLIMTRDGAISKLNEVTVIPITSTIRNIRSQVLLTVEDGMEMDCVANVDWIQTLPKGKLSGHVTQISDERLEEILDAIRFAFGYED